MAVVEMGIRWNLKARDALGEVLVYHSCGRTTEQPFLASHDTVYVFLLKVLVN